MHKILKVAYSNRIIPHYRSPVFVELSKRSQIDLTVFYGKGLATGSQANDDKPFDLNAVKLFTIPFVFRRGNALQLRVWHPTLLFHFIYNQFDIVITEPSTNFLNNISVFIYCKLFKKKMIWYESGVSKSRLKSKKRYILELIIKKFIYTADAFITYNSFAHNYLIANYNISPNKIFRAQNTINMEPVNREKKIFQPKVIETKKNLGINTEKVIAFIGGIEKRKKVENIIMAAKKYSEKYNSCVALIVGDGPDLDYYKKHYSNNGYPVIYVGKRIDDAALMLLISDIVILPGEGGLAINHAFACGKPFIGTNECVSGDDSIRDYVIDGYNGYVAEVDSVDDLVNKIDLVFNNYRILCKGANESSKLYTIPKLVDGMVDAIEFAIEV
jgi:glycosyltransferase involved in cell wall biosynthesis